jgi:hypothetical protein
MSHGTGVTPVSDPVNASIWNVTEAVVAPMLYQKISKGADFQGQ